jgi:predicted nucleotidyltransferase
LPELRPKFRTAIKVMDAAGVRFVVIGGVAMALHGSAHLTVDIDFCYARTKENFQAVAAAIAPYTPTLRGAPDDLPFIWDAQTVRSGLNFTLKTRLCDIDLLGEVSGIESFEQLWGQSVIMEVEGVKVHVASIDDLLAMKVAAGRIKDQIHEIEIRALQKILRLEEKPLE